MTTTSSLGFVATAPTVLQGSVSVKLTDVHIHMHAGDANNLTLHVEGCLLFPGPVASTDAHAQWLAVLAAECTKQLGPGSVVDYALIHSSNCFYRLQKESHAVDGIWYLLRRMPDEPPELDKLPTAMAQAYQRVFMDSSLCAGGLVMITGGPGCGKTTTGSAVVISRLKKYGGMAITVEDPPEFPLNGRHGNGYCRQTNVITSANLELDCWAASLRSVLRSQPVGAHLILYVGELRSPDAAKMMLQAAANGFLVICTAFASDIPTAVETLLHMMGQDYRIALSQVLRVLEHQTIRDGRFTTEMIHSDGSSSEVAVAIRHGQLGRLRDIQMYQRNTMLATPRQTEHA